MDVLLVDTEFSLNSDGKFEPQLVFVLFFAQHLKSMVLLHNHRRLNNTTKVKRAL